MDVYHDQIKKKKRESSLKIGLDAAKTAAEWGGGLGTLDALLWSGKRKIPEILKMGAGHAGLWGAIGGGAAYLGDKLLGPANPEDPTSNTKLSAAGGAVGGGLGGAALGAALGSGKLAGLSHLPGAARVGNAVKSALPLDNLIADYVKKKMASPGSGSSKALAAALGLGGLGVGALYGASTGMDLDTANNIDQGDEDEHARELDSGRAAY